MKAVHLIEKLMTSIRKLTKFGTKSSNLPNSSYGRAEVTVVDSYKV